MERLRITRGGVAEAVSRLRPTRAESDEVERAVADIVAMVREGGDDALQRLTARLDGVEGPVERVPEAALDEALAGLDHDVRDALAMLAENVRRVAEEIRPTASTVVLPQGQTVCTRPLPVDRAGVYVPGGRAPYPSSAVMAIVPAQVAGVAEVVVCSPPAPDGRPHALVLAACALLGVREVYGIGGAQAIAALALGTETIRRVEVLVGPGNAFVEEAKRQLYGEVGIESLAGPSELVVVADASAPVEALTADLLAQLEHGAGAQSLVVGVEAELLDAVAAALPAETEQVTVVDADSWDTVFAFANAYAPEHLQLMVADPHGALERVRHAGAVFLGHHAGTAFGDYAAGSNHILPTGGHARFSSGLSPTAFLRVQEVVEIGPAAVEALTPAVTALAHAEGFPVHARSAEIRVRGLVPQPTPER